MKRLLKYGLFVIALTIASCNDNAVVDTNQVISGYKWSYINKVKIPVKIEDNTKSYKLFLNLRHTAEYKYSNIFVLIHQSGPGMKPETVRKEFKLAFPDGEWLGKGSGDLYSYQLLFKDNYKFPAKGTYTFQIEQNMRDNPLQDVSDVGLRVEVTGN